MYNELLALLKENYVKKDYKLELFDYKIQLNSFMSDVIMNDITTKIRGYNKRKPNTDKKFKFSNDLIERSVYVGKEKTVEEDKS